MLLSIPVSYYIIEKMLEKNVDENLLFQKEWLITQLRKSTPGSKILNRNIAVQEGTADSVKADHFSNRSMYDEKDDDYVNHRILEFSQSINGKNYHFELRHSLVENEEILRAVTVLQSSILLILVLSLVFISRRVERQIWTPFYHMLEALKQYRLDRHNFSVPERSPVKEMNDLYASLSGLTDNNQKLFTAQKEFTENASHELQTPVAIIQNKLEMLMQTEPLTEQQSTYIADLYAINQKLAKMNRSLLLLARIENQQFEDSKAVSLRKIIQRIVSDSAFLAEEKNVRIETFAEAEKIVYGNETLLNILFGNLISNALKYNDFGGAVTIWLTAGTFEISNTSSLEKLDSNLLFRRFQKQNTSRESNGLGLEICDKICKIYSWKLSYRHTADLHRFMITFQS